MEDYKYNEDQLAWLNDLKTTDAKQCKGALEKDGAYCSLGRACIVLGAERVQYTNDMVFFNESSAFLSKGVEGRLKLRTQCGAPNTIHLKSCTIMNDTLDYTFKQITEVIEANHHAYFTD